MAPRLVCAEEAADAPAAPAVTEDAAQAPHVALQTRWAEIKYDLPGKQQAAAFEALARSADAAVAANPDDAAVLIWRGIVLSTWAGAKGGLGALPLVKRAKADFEAALALDEGALSGSAHTSLGSLYYQVPGWPVGFGDDDKAREHLSAGLALNPDGMDSNFFWGDFLRQEGDKQGAIAALRKALAASPRPGRERADAGRREEILALLAEIGA
jgi:tetratricopeptide (TPR) repeat protein